MKTLTRNTEGIYNTAQNYHRKFSAITRGARADRPRTQECLVLVEARDTYTPLLHQILQSCARTGAPMEVDCAGKVFDEMHERSLVSWNTMIGSLTQNGEEQKALGLFLQMRREGNHFSEFTISSVLCACAAKCAVFECKQLHALAVKLAMNLNVYVGTALLEVYAKSGLIKDASSVFASLPERSEVTWSSMVAGYVQNELYEEALMFFHRAKMMGLEQNQFTISSAICACAGLAALIQRKQQMGTFPSEVTYVSVLTACSHMGLVESGRKYFNLMITEHNVSPNVVHYSCMVDLFGRSGLLLEAYNLIEEMPFDATASRWGSLLASCRIHGKLHLAVVAAKHLSEIEPNNA
ncbi:hypothetical protein Pyn_28269 [Prunus yedoensis var. nudiflora]|uniref:Pentatricopeptide repeat-containing protein n=1 Tax=Prunus yedoensis var. nudiflora TaxID=2094558 RepID=A0A314ZJS9_PRUYE|nr:hypothetical protein Pyn_28269 [Prunus yedoensis var. nudiflora]